MLAVTVLELARNDLTRLEAQLADKVAKAPNFFHDTPVLLGFEQLPAEDAALDLAALVALCRRHGLLTLGARASRAGDIAAVQAFGLPLLPSASGRERPLDPPPAAEPAKPAAPPVKPTLVVTRPVRGGQTVYAEGGDLVVLSPVSSGAELLADGNIHIYGPLRGRVMAGRKGNREARIFCQQLTAELISIAGQYKVAEDLRRSPQWGKAVQISLSGDVLNITRL